MKVSRCREGHRGYRVRPPLGLARYLLDPSASRSVLRKGVVLFENPGPCKDAGYPPHGYPVVGRSDMAPVETSPTSEWNRQDRHHTHDLRPTTSPTRKVT